MATNVKKMKPIWFFVGVILQVMGGLIFGISLYDWIAGVESRTVLANLHPGVWWGGLMSLAGFVFELKNINASIE